jgi:long-chain acyl-CoA synthetase
VRQLAMHPAAHAKTQPDRPAIIMAGSGQMVTYRQLDERANQGASFFRRCGLRQGDVVALFCVNGASFLEAAWAAQRSGLLFTCVSTRSSPDELAYILRDSGAKLLLCSQVLLDVARRALTQVPAVTLYIVDATNDDDLSFQSARAQCPITPIGDECLGVDLLYSSGTTGRPKGIRPKVATGGPIDTPDRVSELARARFGLNQQSIYLSPAPLYHAAPMRWSMAVHRVGGTVVMLEKFEPLAALQAIEQYRVNVSQWVPTHFVRLLRLSQTERESYDLSSLKIAIHAAAPCAIPVKEAMIAWWGPILTEYYAGTEGIGMTQITSEEWLQKKGSVGRAISGELHICDELGSPVPQGTTGIVYFSGGGDFEYHNDIEATRRSHNKQGWATFGDVGYVDADVYLFLTDRQSFMIISGGVNIYPQEIENQLMSHPAVADAAVVGAPDEEMGERVVAVIQPLVWSDAGPGLAADITDFLRAHMNHVKVPRQVDFVQQLPRHENGKLYKKLIRDGYWRDPHRSAADGSGLQGTSKRGEVNG